LFLSSGFLERNRDTFHGDLISLIQNSKNKFLKLLFEEGKVFSAVSAAGLVS